MDETILLKIRDSYDVHNNTTTDPNYLPQRLQG
jgi:hypothetical protein